MKKSFYVALGLLLAASAFQTVRADDKARTLKVKVNYTGSGTVDDKHQIQVFVFDSPDFAQGNAMPVGMQAISSKTATATFSDIAKSPAYVAVIFDPTGGYDGQSAPPSGSSIGMYTKEPPQPGAIEIGEGKTVEVEVAFDDSFKMP